MKLSFKDLKFILEALELLLSRYDTRLKEIEDLEEDEEEASDLGNDYLFLESLKLEIEKNINNNKSSNYDTSSQLLAARNFPVESSSSDQVLLNTSNKSKNYSVNVNIDPTGQPSIIITNKQLLSINSVESINYDSMPQEVESENLEFIIQSTSNLSINERLLMVEAITKSIREEANLININH